MTERDVNRGRVLTCAFQLIALFDRKKWVTYADVQEDLDCCRKTARRYVLSMQEAGYAIRSDNDGPTKYFTRARFRS